MDRPKATGIRNIVVISDTHAGSRVAICPPDGITLDDGGTYIPHPVVARLWDFWREFWDEWVPAVTRRGPYLLVHNGDALEGNHHGTTHNISNNRADQLRIAEAVLGEPTRKAAGYYHIRGTEAHAGQSAEDEEILAERLGAIPNDAGQRARWDLWIRVGYHLIHIMHPIGTTGSSAYEATAVHKEMVEEYQEAARWAREPPAMIVRSHRHRCIEIRAPNARGEGIALVTPSWQLRTPHAWKISGARLSEPQIGGSLIRVSEEGEIYARHYVRTIGRSGEVIA